MEINKEKLIPYGFNAYVDPSDGTVYKEASDGTLSTDDSSVNAAERRFVSEGLEKIASHMNGRKR